MQLVTSHDDSQPSLRTQRRHRAGHWKGPSSPDSSRIDLLATHRDSSNLVARHRHRSRSCEPVLATGVLPVPQRAIMTFSQTCARSPLLGRAGRDVDLALSASQRSLRLGPGNKSQKCTTSRGACKYANIMLDRGPTFQLMSILVRTQWCTNNQDIVVKECTGPGRSCTSPT